MQFGLLDVWVGWACVGFVCFGSFSFGWVVLVVYWWFELVHFCWLGGWLSCFFFWFGLFACLHWIGWICLYRLAWICFTGVDWFVGNWSVAWFGLYIGLFFCLLHRLACLVSLV